MSASLGSTAALYSRCQQKSLSGCVILLLSRRKKFFFVVSATFAVLVSTARHNISNVEFCVAAVLRSEPGFDASRIAWFCAVVQLVLSVLRFLFFFAVGRPGFCWVVSLQWLLVFLCIIFILDQCWSWTSCVC